MDIEEKIKTKLLSKGFSKETLLNNRGLIGATIDETIVVGNEVKFESGLTCMMCRQPKENDGHTCCEDCAGLAF